MKSWNHPCNTVAEVIASMECGNRSLHPDGIKNTCIGKHALLIGRRYPALSHHFTESELVSFLEQDKYPSITFKDHERSRIATIREALLNGKFVPADVMAESGGKEALDDAVMYLRSGVSAALKADTHQQARLAFEKAIGYVETEDVYEARIAALLITACTTGNEVFVSRLGAAPVPGIRIEQSGIPDFECLTLLPVIVRKTPMNNGSYLSIRDGALPDVSVYGQLYAMDLMSCERRLTNLIQNGQLSLTQCQRLMGLFWNPYLCVESFYSAA